MSAKSPRVEVAERQPRRKCIQCDKVFQPQSRFNRRCTRCHDKDVYEHRGRMVAEGGSCDER
jgi:Zn finger protein HypA/HybF involved in hydrogenase expression